MNRPSSFVLSLRTSPVRSFVSVSVAPGITAPEESMTTPDMVPVTLCVHAGTLASSAQNNPESSKNARCFVMVTPFQL
jgi:hypothetical protein